MTAWEDLVARAERELALVRGGRVEELPGLLAERARITDALGPAPAAARPLLERLAAVQDQLVVELTLARAATARELASLRRGGAAVRGYASAAGPTSSRIDGAA